MEERSPTRGSGSLRVRHADEEVVVPPGRALSFGRDAELVVDATNRYLHRVLGVFACLDGVWWLQNVGRHIPLSVRGAGAASRVEVAPGAQVALVQPELTVAFSAGPCRYVLECALTGFSPLRVEPSPATDTIQFGGVRLNPEQTLLVVALAEPLLRDDPGWPASMPTNREVACRLGWTLTKFNRKLDYLCRRLAEAGVDGLQGGVEDRASSRRLRLVEHLVARGAVDVDDLARLESP